MKIFELRKNSKLAFFFKFKNRKKTSKFVKSRKKNETLKIVTFNTFPTIPGQRIKRNTIKKKLFNTRNSIKKNMWDILKFTNRSIFLI